MIGLHAALLFVFARRSAVRKPRRPQTLFGQSTGCTRGRRAGSHEGQGSAKAAPRRQWGALVPASPSRAKKIGGSGSTGGTRIPRQTVQIQRGGKPTSCKTHCKWGGGEGGVISWSEKSGNEAGADGPLATGPSPFHALLVGVTLSLGRRRCPLASHHPIPLLRWCPMSFSGEAGGGRGGGGGTRLHCTPIHSTSPHSTPLSTPQPSHRDPNPSLQRFQMCLNHFQKLEMIVKDPIRAACTPHRGRLCPPRVAAIRFIHFPALRDPRLGDLECVHQIFRTLRWPCPGLET